MTATTIPTVTSAAPTTTIVISTPMAAMTDHPFHPLSG
jgi:hypothetical protein